MRRFAARLLFGVMATLVAAEGLFRLLPVSTATFTGYHHDPDLLTYPAHHHWRVATGWDLRNAQMLSSNNQGFVAEHDFVVDPKAVALIGDSYVEASMLDAADRPDAQLERQLGGRTVYAMGGPGSSLLDYAQRIRWASQRFKVRDMVLLLERYDARQALCGSGNVHSRCLDRGTLAPRIVRQEPAGFLKRILRHSALAQYLAGQIKFRPEVLWRAMFSHRSSETSAPASSVSTPPDLGKIALVRRQVDAVTSTFFETVREHPVGRLVVLVDGRRQGSASGSELIDLERTHLMTRLREGGAVVIDLEPVYARHAENSRRSLDVGPYDGHLNSLGIELAMREAARVLTP
jgi:hypothetical protein